MSDNTIIRRLRVRGLLPCRAVRKPNLPDRNVQERLNFSRLYAEKGPEFWRNVIFSDEKTFGSVMINVVLTFIKS